jgi:ribosomal protein S12 methylthiotransferase accessory factor
MPRLRADVRTRVVAPATVILSDGDDVPFVLESPALAAMVPLLDGRTPIERIAVAIADRASLTDIVLAITSLERAGLIVEGPGLDDGAAAAYWEASGVDAADAVQRLADAGVATLAVGGVELDSLHGALAELGVAVREDAALTCVLADDYLQPELDEVSRRLAGTPWLVARPLGRELWLGPFFRSPESGCWSCLVERLRAHPRATEGPRPTLPTTEAAAAALVATQIAMILASGRSQALEGALVTINTATLELQRHALLPAAGCTVCGDPSPSSSPRSRTAGETLARLLPELSPVLGFVGGLTRAPSPLGDVVHVWFAGRGGSAAGGKGRTETEAKASAVWAAVELACGQTDWA